MAPSTQEHPEKGADWIAVRGSGRLALERRPRSLEEQNFLLVDVRFAMCDVWPAWGSSRALIN